MDPTLLDLLLRQRHQSTAGEGFTAGIPNYQFQGGRNPGEETPFPGAKADFYDIMAPMTFQGAPAKSDGMLNGSMMGVTVGQRPQLFDLNAGIVAGAPGSTGSTPAPFDLIGAVHGGKFLPTPGTPEARMPTPPAALMTMDRANQNIPGLASKGWSESKMAEYYGGDVATPWSWKLPEDAAPAVSLVEKYGNGRAEWEKAGRPYDPAQPFGPGIAPPVGTPEYKAWNREANYSPDGTLKPENDASLQYVGNGQYQKKIPYDPIAAAKQRALSDPRVQAVLAEKSLENQGRLDAILAQDKGMMRGKESDARALMASQAVAGITDPVQKMRAFDNLTNLERVKTSIANSELGAAGIRTPGGRGNMANPLASPAVSPLSLEEEINRRVNEDAAIKGHTDRIAKLFQTAPVMNGAALVPGGSPLDPSKYNPEMANNLADILNSASTPAEKQAVMKEVARLAVDKNAIGDAMVRAAAGNATLGGLPGLSYTSIPETIAGKDMDAPFDLTRSELGFFGTLARAPNRVLGKPEAMYSTAVLPGGRKVEINTGDLYGARNQIAASAPELQRSAARKAALKQYLEAFMGQGYYGKAQ